MIEPLDMLNHKRANMITLMQFYVLDATLLSLSEANLFMGLVGGYREFATRVPTACHYVLFVSFMAIGL